MKRRMVITLLVIAVACPAVAQRPKSKSAAEGAEQELLKLEAQWAEAMEKRDLAFFERVYAEDYTFIDPTGAVFDRKADLEHWKSGTLVFDSVKFHDLHVRAYGNTAVVLGRAVIKGKAQSQDISGSYRFTDVFVRNTGRWQCVAAQVTGIAKP